MSFEYGDKVIDLRYGTGTVRSVNMNVLNGYPIFVEFEKDNRVGEYTKEGRYLTTDAYPVLYHAEGFTLPTCSESERKPKCDFQPFDKVLVCDGTGCHWMLSLFARYTPKEDEHYPYETINGSRWSNCIPFEGNEDKLGEILNED